MVDDLYRQVDDDHYRHPSLLAMSLRKGDRRKKAQRHQNSTAFKAGLHCQSGKKAKDAASIVLAGLCGRCREKIEWKIKYDKYKPLTAPRKW